MNADIPTSFAVICKRDPQHSMERFYALSVQRNLFGSCRLIKQWGQIGRPGKMNIELYDSFKHAVDAFHVKRRQKQKQGYI